MQLPQWAYQALETYRPMASFKNAGAADAKRLQAWESLRARLVHRWHELGAEHWRVPQSAADPDRVRQGILEAAAECALDCHRGNSPARSIEVFDELDRLNEQINVTASALASLVRQRQALIESEGVDDWESEGADPLELWAWLASLEPGPLEFRRLVTMGLGTSREMPGLLELLEDIAQRYPAKASPLFGVDRRERMSRKRSGWTPWAARLMLSLERTSWMYDCDLLGCLTPERLSALLCVCLDAPLEAFTPDAVKQLRARHVRSLKALSGNDSD